MCSFIKIDETPVSIKPLLDACALYWCVVIVLVQYWCVVITHTLRGHKGIEFVLRTDRNRYRVLGG